MSWQQELYQWLREADREWMTSGELFVEHEAKIPLHVAMRHAVALYGENRISGGKAQWLYFTQTLKQIGVERIKVPGGRYWSYGDKVRIRHVDGYVCPKCGGPVIYGGWSSRSVKNMVCLACTRYRETSSVAATAPPLAATAPPLAAPPSVSAPLPSPPPLEQIRSATPTAPSSSSVIYSTMPSPPPALPKTAGERARGSFEIQADGFRVIAYRRTLARELRPHLNVSINRLERELERHGDSIAMVLALHGRTTNCLPPFFVHRVATRAVFERMIKNGSSVIERIFGRGGDYK